MTCASAATSPRRRELQSGGHPLAKKKLGKGEGYVYPHDDPAGFDVALTSFRPDVVVVYDDVFNWFTKMCLGRMRQAAFEMLRAARAAGNFARSDEIRELLRQRGIQLDDTKDGTLVKRIT